MASGTAEVQDSCTCSNLVVMSSKNACTFAVTGLAEPGQSLSDWYLMSAKSVFSSISLQTIFAPVCMSARDL
eukprot:scaffold29847_cov68-Phaeocystis_antarctica.AAC.1